MEELINQIQNGNYKEAYEGFKKIYEEKGDILAFYYMTMIDYQFHQVSHHELIKRLEHLIKKGNYFIKEQSLVVYLSILMFDFRDLDKAYQISYKAYKKGNRMFLVSFAYAYTSYITRNDTSDTILVVLEEALHQDDFNDSFKISAYEIMIKIYLQRKEIDKAKHLLGKLTLLFPQDVRLHAINLFINFKENENDIDQYSLEEILSSSYCLEFINELSNTLYNEKKYELCIKYLNMALGRTNSDLQIKMKIAICLSDMKKFDEAIRLIENSHENNDNALFLLAEIYAFKGDKESLNKSLEYCLNTYANAPSLPKLKVLGDIYNKLYDYDNLLKVISTLQNEYKDDDYYHLLKACYYQDHQEFDSCEKEVRSAKKVKSIFLADLAFASFKNHNNAIKYYRLHMNKNDYLTLIAKYYGEFNCQRSDFSNDLNKVENGIKDNFDYALLGNIYLKTDISKAYNYINEGFQRYINKTDNCISCVSYYVYLLTHGIYLKKDLNKAYQICKETLEKEDYHVDENLGNIYAELSLLLNKDLENVYSFLVQTRERRYSLSRMYMIIKVGKALNKNMRKEERIYRKTFKFANILEKEYYKDNPKVLMLNNF